MELTPDERAALLHVARVALAVAVRSAPRGALRDVLERAGSLDWCAAAFVTLTADGQLRGCMGSLDAEERVAESVATAALLVASSDPRFLPVTARELPTLRVDVSVLSPMQLFDGPSRFRPGVDGLLIRRGGRQGLLLPDVATTFGWGALEMLAAVCEKAGLPGNTWCDPRAEVLTFTTARFGGAASDSDASA